MQQTLSTILESLARAAILCGILGSLLGCGPQGEIVQNIQPPHQAYLDRQNPVKSKLTHLRASGGEQGLPVGCNFTRPLKARLCLSCNSGEWLVARCYNYEGDFNVSQSCQYTADTIKCLVDEPPFALALSYRVSQEKFLRDNYLLWQQTIRNVWNEKLQGTDLSQLNDVLAFFDRSTQWLSKSSAESPAESELKDALAFLPPPADRNVKEAKKFLQELQALRIEGKLKFAQVLSRGDAFLQRVNASPKAREAFKSLNTQGMDD